LIIAIIVGGVAGWLASLVMNRDASMALEHCGWYHRSGNRQMVVGPSSALWFRTRILADRLLIAVVGAVILSRS
jgi:uncharacterized membrane protein YeaQ/YmgE (transglycosylase-associated protein family)